MGLTPSKSAAGRQSGGSDSPSRAPATPQESELQSIPVFAYDPRQPTPIDELVDDVMYLIFSYLTYSELVVASCACRKWRELSLEVRGKEWRIRRNIKDKDLAALAATHPTIHFLDLRYCHNISGAGFLELVPSLQHLKVLDLSECMGIVDDDITAFLAQVKLDYVHTLSLRMCAGMLESAVRRMVVAAPNVRILDLSYLKLSCETLDVITTTVGSRLRSLTLKQSNSDMWYPDNNEGKEAFARLCAACPEVESLRVPHLNTLSEQSVASLALLSRLTTLDIVGWNPASFDTSQKFNMLILPRLRSLSLSTIVLNQMVQPELNTSWCEGAAKLEHLHVQGYAATNIPEHELAALIALPNVRTLRLGDCTPSTVISVARAATKLEMFSFYSAQTVQQAELAAFPHINFIELSKRRRVFPPNGQPQPD